MESILLARLQDDDDRSNSPVFLGEKKKYI